jgi:nicotinamidase-related amidase
MTAPDYSAVHTAVLLIDPYNDFLSEGGKLAAPAKAVMDAVHTIAHMRAVVAAARAAGIRIVYVPHHRSLPDDFKGWKHANPVQLMTAERQVFAAGSWGGEWHPDFVPQPGDVIAKEHWSSSGFANTDLDFLLQQHGIQRVVLIGLIANTCLESTGKYAAELGYHVTLVRDATAAFTPLAMTCAHEINGPTYAHAIVSTAELLTAFLPVGV